jgi:hypothetical protein
MRPKIALRGRWCHIIVLNVKAPSEDKIDDVKDRIYEELKCVFDTFSKIICENFVTRFHAKVDKEDIFKQKIGNIRKYSASTS